MAITTMIDSPATSAAPRARRRGTFSADKLWALAFVTPYVAVFVAFVIYPIGYGLWLGSDPASYRAELVFKVKIPKPHKDLAAISKLNSHLPVLLPSLATMIEAAKVSPVFEIP